MSSRSINASAHMDRTVAIDGASAYQMAELQKMRDMATYNRLTRLEMAADSAIETLIDLVAEGNTPSTRLKAADSILTHLLDHKKLYDFAAKLAVYEEMASKASKAI